MTTITGQRAEIGAAAGLEHIASKGLRFLLMDPYPATGEEGLGAPTDLAGPGERSAMGLVDGTGMAAARVDLLVAPDRVGHWWIRVRPELRGQGIGKSRSRPLGWCTSDHS